MNSKAKAAIALSLLLVLSALVFHFVTQHPGDKAARILHSSIDVTKSSKKNFEPIKLIPESAKRNAQPIGPWISDFAAVHDSDRILRIGDGVLNDSQKLSPTAVRHFGFTLDEELSVNKLLATYFVDAKSIMMANMIHLDNAELGSFRLKPDIEAAKKNLIDLHDGLVSVLGPDRGGRLLNAVNFWNYYAGGGLLDGEIKFFESKNAKGIIPIELPARVYCSIELRDPVTGSVRQQGSYPIELIEKKFGSNTFQLKSE